MIAALALALALATQDHARDAAAEAFDTRMAASADAAERLQGELDGRWTLADARGRPMFVFQISDPPQHAAPLQAAWRRVNGRAVGVVEAIAGAGRRLTMSFGIDGRTARVSLRRSGDRVWRGWLLESGRRLRVSLRR